MTITICLELLKMINGIQQIMSNACSPFTIRTQMMIIVLNVQVITILLEPTAIVKKWIFKLLGCASGAAVANEAT